MEPVKRKTTPHSSRRSKRRTEWFLSGIVLVLMILTALTVLAQDVPMKIKVLESELRHIAQNPELVNAVAESNKKTYSMNEIEELENEWKATWEGTGIVKPVLTNRIAFFLKQLKWTAHHPGMFQDIAVMNMQGLIIAAVEKEEHLYWGDQQEFLEAYAGGDGAIYYGTLDYDGGAFGQCIKVGVPIKDPGTGNTIGVICFGINIDVF